MYWATREFRRKPQRDVQLHPPNGDAVKMSMQTTCVRQACLIQHDMARENEIYSVEPYRQRS